MFKFGSCSDQGQHQQIEQKIEKSIDMVTESCMFFLSLCNMPLRSFDILMIFFDEVLYAVFISQFSLVVVSWYPARLACCCWLRRRQGDFERLILLSQEPGWDSELGTNLRCHGGCDDVFTMSGCFYHFLDILFWWFLIYLLGIWHFIFNWTCLIDLENIFKTFFVTNPLLDMACMAQATWTAAASMVRYASHGHLDVQWRHLKQTLLESIHS